jgi:Carboxypeptidase regulatory-like domain
MKHRTVAALAVLVVFACGSMLEARQRTGVGGRRGGPPRPAVDAATIVGRVFDANTRAPVRRAQIQATNDEMFIDGTTDDDGRFQLNGLSAGQWRVTISKGGYYPWYIGQRRPFEIPPPVAIAARQRVEVDVPLTRGGVIAGRVFDQSGEPLAGLQVKVYRARMSQGYRRLESVGVPDRTDDTGAYRIYALPPGDYYVAASLRMAPADSIVETTYAPTYYPGTGDLGEAERIRIGLGSEATAVFPLLPVRHVHVSGTMVTSSGAPADALLTLTSVNSELGMPLGIGGVSRRDGSFTIADVPPGRYTLTATLRSEGPPEVASMPVVVGEDDVSGLALVSERLGRLQGRFVVDAGVTRRLPEDLEVMAIGARVNGTLLSRGTGSSFVLDEVGEPFFLRVDVPQGWVVKRVEIGGVDVTDSRSITVSLGQQTETRIVISDRVSEVTGTVMAAGKPAPARVVVFAADQTKWGYPSRFVREATADARGRFRVTGLPQSDRYLAIAVDYLEDGEHNDPEFLQRMRDTALPFPLGDAEVRSLDLTLVER